MKRGKDRPKRPLLRQNRVIFLLILIFVAFISTSSLVASYRSARAGAFERVVISARSYGEFVSGVLRSIDVAVAAVASHARTWGEGPAPPSAPVVKEMEHQMLVLPNIATLEYYDREGTLIAGVPETSLELGTSLTEDLVSRHRDAWVDGAVTSMPGAGTLRVSRAIVVDGVYEGVVIATIAKDFFYDAISQLFPSAVSHIAVFDKEGEFLLHWGEVDHELLPASLERPEGEIERGGLAVGASKAFFGGETQIRAYPLRLALYFDRSLLMQDWERQLDYTIVLFSLFWAAGFVVYRYVRRLQAKQAEVQAELSKEQESRAIAELIRRVREEAYAAESEAELLQASICELSTFLGAVSAEICSFEDDGLPESDFRIEMCGNLQGPPSPSDTDQQTRVPIRVGSKTVGLVEFQLPVEPSEWHIRVVEQALTLVGGALLRRRIEGKLRDTEARLSAFMNNSPSINYVRDAEGAFVYANPAFRKIFGEPESQGTHHPVPKNAEDLVSESVEWGPDMPDSDAIVVSRKQQIRVGDTVHTFATRVFPFRDSAGRVFTGGVGIDITETERSREQLKKALEDRELLLREIHHRVKNNLAVIDSLLSFEQQKTTPRSPNDIIFGVRSRIQAIALIHKRLYRSESLTSVPFKEYCEELIDYILQTMDPLEPGATDVRLNVDSVELDINVVKPLGLILHELVANAVKYARRGGEKLQLDVAFTNGQNGRYSLAVRDNGDGFTEEPVPDPESSLGFFVVHALCDELSAELETWNDNGANVRVTLPQLG